MRLSILLRISYPLLENLFCLLYELPMQIYCVVRDSALRIILSENIVRRLFIVLIHLRSMFLSFLRELMSSCSITMLVCLL
jgi:hypothetical protein